MNRRKFVRNALLGAGVAGVGIANVVLFERRNQQAPLSDALRPDQDLCSIAFSLRGNQVFAASANKEFTIWDAAAGRRIRSAHTQAGKITRAGFLSCDTLIAAVAGNGVQFYRSRELTGSSSFSFNAKSACVAFSPKQYLGVWMAAGLTDHTIRILWKSPHTNEFINSGTITLGTRTFHITQPTQFVEWDKLKGHTGNVNGVSFSQDGSLMASASSDQTIRIRTQAVGSKSISSAAIPIR